MQGCSQTQPVPRAAFRRSYSDKHNRPRSDSNLGPLTPQAEALTIRPLRPAGRAALTGKHDTLVRRAPGWQGAPDGQQAKK